MIKQASKQASKSLFSRARIGAVVANKNRVLSTGKNSIRHYKCPTEKPWKDSLHAEQDAILKMLNNRRQADLIGATIYVSRVKKDGSPGLAKPCNFCMELITSVGIKRVVYTQDDGNTGVIEL